jgi:hypothetical protein
MKLEIFILYSPLEVPMTDFLRMHKLKSKGYFSQLVFVSLCIEFELEMTHNIHRIKCGPLLQKLAGIVGHVGHHQKWAVIQGICPKELENMRVAVWARSVEEFKLSDDHAGQHTNIDFLSQQLPVQEMSWTLQDVLGLTATLGVTPATFWRTLIATSIWFQVPW